MIAATSTETALVGVAAVVFAVLGALMLLDIGGLARAAARQSAAAVSRGEDNREIMFYPTTPGAARFLGACVMVGSLAVLALILTGNADV